MIKASAICARGEHVQGGISCSCPCATAAVVLPATAQPWLQLGRATEKSRRAESAAGEKATRKRVSDPLTAEKPKVRQN